MIFCVGNPVYDSIQTPSTSIEDRVLSGCSTNACLVLSKLGTECKLIGRIGNDFYERLINDLEKHKIIHDISLAEETTGFKLVYDETGNRTLDVIGNAGPIINLPSDLMNAEAAIFGPVLGEVDLALIKSARDKMKIPFLLDPQGLVRRLDESGRVVHYFNPNLSKILPLFDIVKADEHAAEVITGINPRQDLLATITKLHEYGCNIAIITLAEAGSAIFDGLSFYHIPAYVTFAKDPTGAGDTYAGSFIYRYLRNGNDLLDAAYFASAASSIVVEYSGPEFPMTLLEIEKRLKYLLEDGH